MNAKRKRKLQTIYSRVPRVKCKGLCDKISCTELALSVDEVKNLHKESGEVTKMRDGLCNHLKDGRCKVYGDRPVVCRLWGVTESMRCPHGCEAERILSDGEARKIVNDVFKLSDGKWVDNT